MKDVNKRSKKTLSVLMIVVMILSLLWNAAIPTKVLADGNGTPVRYVISEDTYVQGGTTSGTNYGTSAELLIKGVLGNDSAVRHSYLKFSGLPEGHVDSATLHFYVTSADQDVTNLSLYGLPNDGWSEAGLNWTNSQTNPGMSDAVKIGVFPISRTVGSTSTLNSLDVTDFINSQSDHSATFKMIDEANLNKIVRIASKHHSNQALVPYLSIVPSSLPTLGKVTASIPSGNVTEGTLVELIAPTVSAAVYYTLNGSDPKLSGVRYTGPLTITENIVVKAYAMQEGMNDSEVSTFEYMIATPDAIRLPVSEDTHDKGGADAGNNFGAAATVDVKNDPANATNTRHAFFKWKEIPKGQAASAVLYFYSTTVVTPQTPITVYGLQDDSWSETALTWDNNPSTAGAVLVGEANVSAIGWYSVDVTAFVNSQKADSIASFKLFDESGKSSILRIAPRTSANAAYIKIEPDPNYLLPVQASVPSGSVLLGSKVELNAPTVSSTVYYTTDGSDPKLTGVRYTAPITITGNMVVKAYASQAGKIDSDVSMFTYSVAVSAAATASTPSGPLFSGSTITLTSDTVGSSVYYSLDGTDPRVSGQWYTAPIVISGPATLKAYAKAPGALNSEVSTYTYSIVEPSDDTVSNLPDSFYNREGLETMPRINYAAMIVANVKDFGAVGDGIADEKNAFDRAVNALNAIGGGVLYMPSGMYYFPPSEAPNVRHFWRKAGLNNIHFVGDGESTVIRFNMPGIAALAPGQTPTRWLAYANTPYGWSFGGDNISLRDFSTTWRPRMDVRGQGAPYNVAVTGNNIQVINLTTDQGAVGLVFWQSTNGVWAVDNKVRNTSADSIHFANNINVTAVNNLVENGNDDGLAIVSDTSPQWPISQNNRFFNNTLLNVNWGRGISVGGTQHKIQGNWIEGAIHAGVFLNSLGQSSGDTGFRYQDVSVKNNTIIRANLNNRPDNNVPGNQYGGAITLNNQGDNLLFEGNKIYGSEGNGMITGGWGPVFNGKDMTIRNNEIVGSAKYGISFNDSRSQLENLTVAGNTLLNNDGGSVNFASTPVSGITNYSGNTVTQPTSPTKEGFQVTDEVPQYQNVFEFIMREPGQTGWAEPPTVTLPDQEINVKNYGAVGDGTANDLPSFLNALEALPESGGSLIVPAGTYLLEPVAGQDSLPYSALKHHLLLEGKRNVHVIGEGDRTVLQFTSADHHGLRLLGVTDASIQNLVLELVNQPLLRHNRALIDIAGSRNVVISDVTVRNSGGAGIQIDSSTGVSVKNNVIEKVNMNGIAALASRQVFIEDNRITDSRDNAIHVNKLGATAREPQYIRISRNEINRVTEQSGIGIASGDQVKVEGNTISNTHLAGVVLYYTSEAFHTNQIEVLNNTLNHTNTGDLTYHYGAISVYQSFRGNFLIAGNRIEHTPYAGIWVDGKANLQKLQLSQNVFSGVGTTNIQIDNEQRIGTLIRNDDLLQIQTSPKLPQSGTWAVHVDLTNLTPATALSGKISLSAPTEWAASTVQVAFANLQGGEVKGYDIPVTTPSNKGVVPIKVKVEIDSGATLELDRSLNFLAALQPEQPITIDGDLSEWNNGVPFEIGAAQYKKLEAEMNGSDDLSGAGYMKWDDQNLYLAVRVTDALHAQPNTGEGVWAGDSIQFTIDPGRATGAGSQGYSELSFAVSNTGEITKWRHNALPGKQTGALASSLAAIVRNDALNETLYEIAIPWNELLPVGETVPNSRIGFSFLINDADDIPGKRDGFVEYMSGIGQGKNVSLFGDLILYTVGLEPPVNPQPTSPGSSGNYNQAVTNETKIILNENGTVSLEAPVTTITENGRSTSVVYLDRAALKAAIESVQSKDNGSKVIIVSLLSSESVSMLEMPLDVFASASDTIVSFHTENAAYDLPIKVLDLAGLEKDLGVAAKDIKLSITLKDVEGAEAMQIAKKTDENGLRQLIVPIDFAVVAEAGGKKKVIADFGGNYVTRSVTVPGVVNASQSTVVLYDPESGAFSFVPAVFTTSDGKTVITFARNGNSIYTVVESAKTFEDLKGHWAKTDVELLASKLIVNGVDSNRFAPEQSITRAQFAALLTRSLGLVENKTAAAFTDIQAQDWHKGAVGAAVKAGLVQGYEDGSFRPEDRISREEIVVMISRALYTAGKRVELFGKDEAMLQSFNDRSAISPWAKRAVSEAVYTKIVGGMTDDSFVPAGYATRAQAVVMLKRFLQVVEFIN